MPRPLPTILAACLALALAGAAPAAAQTSATLDSPFQVRAVPKLRKSDLLSVTNTGASGANLCANVYAFEPGGQMVACCSCLVPPNTLRSLAVGADVFEGAKPPKAGLFKVLASTPVGGGCNPASPGALVLGLGAWKGDVQFMPATLSASELNGLVTRCGVLHATPSVCPPCRAQ